MILSDEQMNAVTGSGIAAWEPVSLPIGRQQLPDWLTGVHINWMNGAANAPCITLKTNCNVGNWEGKVWTRRKGTSCYISSHEDGRASVMYHDGAVSPVAVWRVFAGDAPVTYKWTVPERTTGESWVAAASREGFKHLELCRAHGNVLETYSGVKAKSSDLHVVVKELSATTQQQGFGGDGYMLSMADGTELLLRGPWHGGAPTGYVEVSTVDTSSKYHRSGRRERFLPWHKAGGTCGGLYIAEELMLRAVAHFCPHIGIARVTHSYGVRLEPYQLQWNMPKAGVYQIEIERARRKEPAGDFWRVYWDGRGLYCGSLRMPTYGFQEGVSA